MPTAASFQSESRGITKLVWCRESSPAIERALEDGYLSRDPSTSKRTVYIRRTMKKARRWTER